MIFTFTEGMLHYRIEEEYMFKSTRDIDELKGMLHIQSDKPVVITEGDSWFGYPDGLLSTHNGSNIIDYIEDTEQFNILRLESNGDEAGCMMSGKQKAFMIYALREINKVLGSIQQSVKPQVAYLLFSGGGNDIVGRGDMPRFLNPWQDGMDAHAAINWSGSTGFDSEINRIKDAYATLIEIRDMHSPDTTIITHGYDQLPPSGKKAIFLDGLMQFGPWIRPFMVDKGILDPVVQQEIVNIMIERLNSVLDHLALTTNNFIKIDTVGTVNGDQWLNEIHPTKQGFAQLANKFLAKMV